MKLNGNSDFFYVLSFLLLLLLKLVIAEKDRDEAQAELARFSEVMKITFKTVVLLFYR